MKLSSQHLPLSSPVPTSGVRLGGRQTNEDNVTYNTEAWGIHFIVKISYLKSMQLQKYHEFGKYLDIMLYFFCVDMKKQ